MSAPSYKKIWLKILLTSLVLLIFVVIFSVLFDKRIIIYSIGAIVGIAGYYLMKSSNKPSNK